MPQKNQPAILLVDDEAATRRIITDMLVGSGYRVIEAADAREALKILRANPMLFDLLITDLMMPEMKGLDLAGEAETVQPGLKVLYITGDDRSVMAASLQASSALLLKPFSQQRLVEEIRQLLDHS